MSLFKLLELIGMGGLGQKQIKERFEAFKKKKANHGVYYAPWMDGAEQAFEICLGLRKDFEGLEGLR